LWDAEDKKMRLVSFREHIVPNEKWRESIYKDYGILRFEENADRRKRKRPEIGGGTI